MESSLENYIKLRRSQGALDSDIETELLGSGWNLNDIHISLKHTNPSLQLSDRIASRPVSVILLVAGTLLGLSAILYSFFVNLDSSELQIKTQEIFLIVFLAFSGATCIAAGTAKKAAGFLYPLVFIALMSILIPLAAFGGNKFNTHNSASLAEKSFTVVEVADAGLLHKQLANTPLLHYLKDQGYVYHYLDQDNKLTEVKGFATQSSLAKFVNTENTLAISDKDTLYVFSKDLNKGWKITVPDEIAKTTSAGSISLGGISSKGNQVIFTLSDSYGTYYSPSRDFDCLMEVSSGSFNCKIHGTEPLVEKLELIKTLRQPGMLAHFADGNTVYATGSKLRNVSWSQDLPTSVIGDYKDYYYDSLFQVRYDENNRQLGDPILLLDGPDHDIQKDRVLNFTTLPNLSGLMLTIPRKDNPDIWGVYSYYIDEKALDKLGEFTKGKRSPFDIGYTDVEPVFLSSFLKAE